VKGVWPVSDIAVIVHDSAYRATEDDKPGPGLNGNATDPSRRTVPRSRARIPLLIRARPFFRSYSAYLLDFLVFWVC
jgi:hypothetical protein